MQFVAAANAKYELLYQKTCTTLRTDRVNYNIPAAARLFLLKLSGTSLMSRSWERKGKTQQRTKNQHETETLNAKSTGVMCTFVPLSLWTREAVWPGMGTDFLLLLERDVDTNGFEPIPKRKIQWVKKAWTIVCKGKVSMWWICANEKEYTYTPVADICRWRRCLSLTRDPVWAKSISAGEGRKETWNG
jgi:hypothetical protein